MSKKYVEQRKEGFYVSGTRVSLDSLLYEFLRGASPDTIQANWPVLSLEQVYGAITYYLAHRESMDEYLCRAEHEYANAVPPLSQTDPAFYKKLQQAADEMALRKR